MSIPAKEQDDMRESGLIEGNIRLVYELPLFLRQRNLIVKEPGYVFDPPKEFVGWLAPREFAKRNFVYIFAFGGMLEVVGRFVFSIEQSPWILWFSWAEFVLPLCLAIMLYLLSKYIYWFTNKPMATLAKFQYLFQTHVLTLPFWTYVLIILACWSVSIVPPANSGLVSLLLIFVWLAWLYAFLVPLQGIAAACRLCHLRPNWIVAMAFLMYLCLYEGVQLAIFYVLNR